MPEVLAHHHTEAGASLAAITYWLEAGRVAARRPAYDEAITHLSRGLELLEHVPDAAERARLEILLQMTLGAAIQASRGPVEEAGLIYVRAQELCHQMGDKEQLYTAMWGQWHVESQRMNFEVARHLVDDLLQLAEQQGREELLLQAHHACWTTAFYDGRLELCNEQAQQGIALYSPDCHRHQAALYGAHDAGVCCRNHAGLTLWLLGYPERSVSQAQAGLVLAEEVENYYSLTQSLFISSMIQQSCGDLDATRSLAERLVRTASDAGAAVFRESGLVLRGWSSVRRGEMAAGIAEMAEAIDALNAMGAGLRRSYFLWLLADAYRCTGDHARGLEQLAEATDLIAQRGEHWWEPEIHRLRGELLLRRSPAEPSEAEAAFGRAIELAEGQKSRSLQLRGTISLARVWAKQDRHEEAYDLLAPAYGWFTEGFDTADLKDAKVLLDELS